MPDNDSSLSISDLRAMAKELDSTGKATVRDTNDSVKKSESRADTSRDEGLQDNETQDEASQDEIAKQDKQLKSSETDDEPLVDDAEVAKKEKEAKEKADRETERKTKEKARQEKNWDNIQKERAELAKEKEELKKERAKTAKADILDRRDERGYSVKDYQFAIQHFRESGNDELAKQAETAARELYQKSFMEEWKSNLDQLTEVDAELADPQSDLAQAATKVLEYLPMLRQIPDGCKYAVRIAKGDTSASLVSELKAENQKLKDEVDKLSKATRVGVGGPAKVVGGSEGKSFDSMSRDERKKYLRKQAAMADAGGLSDE